MKRLKSFLIALFSPVLALIFSASGLRDGVIRQNRAIMQGPRRRFTHFPRFYRLRLGFHLARALLTLVLPGDLPAARLHPRSRPHLDVLRGGPGLLLTAHFGNWEAQAAAWRARGVNLLGAARPLRSRPAHDLLARLRARHGIRVVTTAVPRTALRHLSAPRHPSPPKSSSGSSSPDGVAAPGCFGLLWDQHAPDATRTGRFCGEPVSLNPLPFFLLARRPCPAYFGVLLPDGTLRLIPLLMRFDTGWEDRLARRYHRVLETLIRRHPAHWHGILHARFKLTRRYRGHRGGRTARS
ncbi:MAG TPA: hypothetical protein VKZ88_04730 [Fibrobacteria bacterium]|nr:hypothetical protein [Fibrobacteria bacterium]